jgi:hypothetical protein
VKSLAVNSIPTGRTSFPSSTACTGNIAELDPTKNTIDAKTRTIHLGNCFTVNPCVLEDAAQ